MSQQPSELHGEAQRLAADVIRRESKRVRTLAVLTICLWLLAALLIAAMALPALAKMKVAAIAMTQPAPGAREVTAQHLAERLSVLLGGMLAIGVIMLGMALLAGLLASICTVALALTIRRTTLRQVSDGLAQISAQLRELKRPPA